MAATFVEANSTVTSSSALRSGRSYRSDQVPAKSVAVALAAAAVASGICATIFVKCARKWTQCIVWMSLLFTPVMMLVAAMAAFALIPDHSSAMVISACLAFPALCFIFCICACWRSLIPFTIEVLYNVASVVEQKTAGLFMVAILGFLGSILWTALCAVAFVAIGQHMLREHHSCMRQKPYADDCDTDGSYYGVYFVLVLLFIWGSTVAINTVHVTNCGVFGRWYFGRRPSVRSSLWVAITTSFGSICLGSLIVSAIQAVEVTLRLMRNAASRDRNLVLVCVLCCLECIVACIRDIVEAFSYLAYVQVAIRGFSFTESARATWALCTFSNIFALMACTLVGSVVTFGALMCGVASAIIGCGVGIALYPDNLSTSAQSSTSVMNFGLGFVVGTVIAGVALNTLRSGFATIVVCWAEDRQPLREHVPALNSAFDARCGILLNS